MAVFAPLCQGQLSVLLFEKIVKGVSRIRRIGRRGVAVSASGIAGFTLYRRTRHEEFALITQVFFGYALGNRLGAFKTCAGIEMPAVLAAVEVGLALRAAAFVVDFDGGRNHGAAQRTA